ncbi:MAG: acetoin utilization protein AcuC [Thermodesulfobacteriota bacterium]
MKAVFIYSDDFGLYSYGYEHPMQPVRLRLTYELITSYGFLDTGSELVKARRANENELLLFHAGEYIKALKGANEGIISIEDGLHFALGHGDNPVFKGVYDWSLYSVGASIQAAELVLKGDADIAFNICGGLHHAMRERASGFCYFNDAAIAIEHLVRSGMRVAYVDIDAHHGDGVQTAFYDSDRVLTISLHENGNYLFPGTGFIDEVGMNKGYGYSINLPFLPGADDDIFVTGFENIVPIFLNRFKPDILVTQLGVDTFRTDPITHLNLTTNGFEKMVRLFDSFKLPWVSLGGGGYNISNVARAWTLAWAIMSGREVAEIMPASFTEMALDYGIKDSCINDTPFSLSNKEREVILSDAKSSIERLVKNVLPLIKKI